ncbi:ROK family transcriptional regulator [Amaricoccus sp. W119]|uniref:ROK family transcriptional regulator n=1 Tax=Amaricoccus sp. W119 TaxID=3391833 RepID=UPI0039A4100F
MTEPFPSSSPRRIRQGNVIAALRALFEHGRLSRAEIARHLGLNRSSSSHIVAELEASALVREVVSGGGGREVAAGRGRRAGRPGILLELDPGAASFIGTEIGVEHITTLRIDLAAGIIGQRVEPFDGRAVPAREAVRRALAQALDGLSPEAAARVEGFGLSAPAQMDATGKVRVAPLLGWRDEDLGLLAREALAELSGADLAGSRLDPDLPIMVENEANAFAFGEGYRDRGGRRGVTLFLVLETGVGGGIVIDGRLFRGGHGLAGEIGHARYRDGGEFEQLLGLGHLLRRYREEGRAPSCSSGPASEDATLADFLDHVRDRVPAAVGIAEDWARDLAHAIATACRLIDPNRIVLGGSVAALYPLVAARVAHYLGAAQAPSFPVPAITVHEAPETSAAFGAACMLHQRFLSLENQTLTDQQIEADPPA